jgi:uncharacterized protein YndB with AHSA1/START domain
MSSDLDLSFSLTVSSPVAHLWKGWTDPELLKKWFCPLPWRTVECEIELRPGGRFHTVMQGPGGERQDNEGVYLEVVPEKRLVWTNALVRGFRPAPESDLGFLFTAIVEFEARGEQTLYRATVLHRRPEDRDMHARAGFEQGWTLALQQLVALN